MSDILRVSEEVSAAAREHSLGVQAMAPAEREQIRGRVRALHGGGRGWMWESFRDCASVQYPGAWRWITEFVGPRECILLFNETEDEEMFSVSSGSALGELLEETYGFEFYVTDRDVAYLICFNHHDFLICCGTAKTWLLARIEELEGGRG